jgi:predicted RND superfamily exporter protein
MKLLWTIELIIRTAIAATVLGFYGFVIFTFGYSIWQGELSKEGVTLFVFVSLIFLPASFAAVHSTMDYWQSKTN